VDLYYCRQRIARERPELGGEGVERLGEGWDSFVVRVGSERVARFAKRAEVAADLAREVKILPWAARVLAPVAVPGAESAVLSTPPAAGDFVIGPLLPGVPAATISGRTGLAPGLAGVLTRLRAADSDGSGLGAETPWPERLALSLRQTMSATGALVGRELRDYVDRLVAEAVAVAPADPGELCVVHGDLTPENLLVEPESARLSAVLDWADAFVGDAAVDLGVIGCDWERPVSDAVLAALDPAPSATFLRRVSLFAQLRPLTHLAAAAEREDPRLRQGALAMLRRDSELERP
jgi:aminoglycoside 2''-phosphotransferase